MRCFIARHINRQLTMGLVQYESPKDRTRLERFFRDSDGYDETTLEPAGDGAVLHRGGYSYQLHKGDYIRPSELLADDNSDSTYVYPQDIIETHFRLEPMDLRIMLLGSFVDAAIVAGDDWVYYSGVENGPDPEDGDLW